MQLLDDITSFMKRHAVPIESWYVGTAANARSHLFKTHGFRETDVGLYRKAGSESDAASLAELLIKRGAKGSVAAKVGAKSIYVFKMATHTNPGAGAN